MEKFYLSNIIWGYGRFAVVIAVETGQLNKGPVAEAHVFALDMDPIYKGVILESDERNEDVASENWTLHILIQEALSQAHAILSELKFQKFKETGEVKYYAGEVDFQETNGDVLIRCKTRYEKELRSIANETASKELREHINRILSFKVKITAV